MTEAVGELLMRLHPLPQWLETVDERRLLAISDAALQLFALERPEVIGRPIHTLLDRSSHGLPNDGERRTFRRPDGTDLTFQVIVQATTWRGQPARLVVLTPAGEATEALLERLAHSELSFRHMAENVPGALYRYIVYADGTDAVVYMSPRCAEIWEVEADVISQDASVLWTMIDPEDLPDMQASVLRSGQLLAPWHHEWRITTPSGKRKWLQGTGRPFPRTEGGVAWNSLVFDITARKEAEEAQARLRRELQQAARLEALGRLAGGVAHDFNNLLTVILGFGEGLLDDPRLAPEVQEDLSCMVDAARRSADLTAQLLALSRHRATNAERIELPVRIGELIRLLRRAVGPDVELEVDTPTDTWPVHMPGAHVDQIVTNLVLNARDAMPGGGRITLRTRNRSAGTDPEHGLVELSVRDTGVGIPKDALSHIFEPFFTTKEDGRGTGLGLATVYGLVQQADGTIDVETTQDVGTRFVIRLPMDRSAPQTRPRPVPSRGAPAGGLALVVDDEPQIARLVERILVRDGWTVHTTFDGASALEAARGLDRVDLLVSDVVMPGTSGVAVRDALRDVWPNLACVLTSAYVDDVRVRKAIDDGVGVVLDKPFSRDDLRRAVETAGDRAGHGRR